MLGEVKQLQRQQAVGKPANWLQRINNHNMTKTARLQLSCALDCMSGCQSYSGFFFLFFSFVAYVFHLCVLIVCRCSKSSGEFNCCFVWRKKMNRGIKGTELSPPSNSQGISESLTATFSYRIFK